MKYNFHSITGAKMKSRKRWRQRLDLKKTKMTGKPRCQKELKMEAKSRALLTFIRLIFALFFLFSDASTMTFFIADPNTVSKCERKESNLGKGTSVCLLLKH